MNFKQYISFSLELHLFFDRIMKEHAFFLTTSFPENKKDLKEIALQFEKEFATILKEVISLANYNISKNFVEANEMVTSMTLDAERKTSELTGSKFDTSLTESELRLNYSNKNRIEVDIATIKKLNSKTISLVKDFIKFKQDILENVLKCKLYTTNYPLLISHILEEAKMYLDLLNKVEEMKKAEASSFYKKEVFWNNIMKEHAWFIHGMLDPSERNLIKEAHNFALDYETILKRYGNNYIRLTKESLKETNEFKKFKVAGLNGILNCEIKSVILPLLSDHVLREANHFLRLLKSISVNL